MVKMFAQLDSPGNLSSVVLGSRIVSSTSLSFHWWTLTSWICVLSFVSRLFCCMWSESIALASCRSLRVLTTPYFLGLVVTYWNVSRAIRRSWVLGVVFDRAVSRCFIVFLCLSTSKRSIWLDASDQWLILDFIQSKNSVEILKLRTKNTIHW